MARPILPNVKLPSIDDLFTPSDVPVISEGQIIEVKISELHPFPNHPFQVKNDEKMQETMESIRNKGVLVPIIIRSRKEGGYELISGHRRTYACKQLGMSTIPAILREMDDDDATIVMVDANIQREQILPSEKAKAYAMKYEAMKRKGSNEGNTLERMGEDSQEGAKTIQRFIWLSRLDEPLMKLVDDGKMGTTQGISLSFLNKVEQAEVYETLEETGEKLSVSQAEALKRWSKEDRFTPENLDSLFNKESNVSRKLVLNENKLKQFFGKTVSVSEIEKTILKLLQTWKEEHDG